jgi:hypothetical protein
MRSRSRFGVLRTLIAGYAAVWTAVRAPALLDPLDYAARRLDPVGPLAFLDAPVADAVLVVAVIATPVASGLLALGRHERWTAPVAAIGFLFVTTYRNSWGQLFHTENLVALHLVVLALAAFAPRADDEDGRRWAVDAMAVMTVGTYFLAGVAKWRISGTAWLDGDVLRHQIAFDNARKEILGDTSSPFAGWLLRQGRLRSCPFWSSWRPRSPCCAAGSPRSGAASPWRSTGRCWPSWRSCSPITCSVSVWRLFFRSSGSGLRSRDGQDASEGPRRHRPSLVDRRPARGWRDRRVDDSAHL